MLSLWRLLRSASRSAETPDSSQCDALTWYGPLASPRINYCELFLSSGQEEEIECSNYFSGHQSCICSEAYTCSMDSEQLIERREADRNQKAEKAKDATEIDEEVSEVIVVEKAATKSVENTAQAVEAENATTQESSSKVAEEASSENVKCDLCESEFQNSRGLRAHKGSVHKNIIPQVDGLVRN